MEFRVFYEVPADSEAFDLLRPETFLDVFGIASRIYPPNQIRIDDYILVDAAHGLKFRDSRGMIGEGHKYKRLELKTRRLRSNQGAEIWDKTEFGHPGDVSMYEDVAEVVDQALSAPLCRLVGSHPRLVKVSKIRKQMRFSHMTIESTNFLVRPAVVGDAQWNHLFKTMFRTIAIEFDDPEDNRMPSFAKKIRDRMTTKYMVAGYPEFLCQLPHPRAMKFVCSSDNPNED
jgi:hypothetical protein